MRDQPGYPQHRAEHLAQTPAGTPSGGRSCPLNRYLPFIALLPFLFLPFAGCTTARPAAAPSDLSPVAGKQPAILYQQIKADAHPAFRGAVDEALSEGWPPEGTTLSPQAEAQANFQLDLDFQIRPEPLTDPETIWQMTAVGFLFTLYPSSCGRYLLELTAHLSDQAGKRLRSWRLLEQDTAFVWLFRGDDCLTQSDETVRKIAKNMLKDLYLRLAAEDCFNARPGALPKNMPLVDLQATNGQPLVQQVAKADVPFCRFTFEQSAAEADYILSTAFETVRHKQSFLGMYLRIFPAIWTLGLVSTCPRDEIILKAKIQDAQGTVLKEYRFSESKRAPLLRAEAPCVPVTIETDPSIGEELLHRLFRQMTDDGIFVEPSTGG